MKYTTETTAWDGCVVVEILSLRARGGGFVPVDKRRLQVVPGLVCLFWKTFVTKFLNGWTYIWMSSVKQRSVDRTRPCLRDKVHSHLLDQFPLNIWIVPHSGWSKTEDLLLSWYGANISSFLQLTEVKGNLLYCSKHIWWAVCGAILLFIWKTTIRST